MYPFDGGHRLLRARLSWLLAGRHLHLVRAIERHPSTFVGESGWTLRRRIHSLRRWGRVRSMVLLGLYVGLATALVGWMLRLFDLSAPLEEILGQFTRLASAFTGILTILALFLTRLLGQLEMDALAIIALETRTSVASDVERNTAKH